MSNEKPISMNPLSRSRLQRTLIGLNYKIVSGDISIQEVETVRAALEHLLNPVVTEEMQNHGSVQRHHNKGTCSDIYLNMIAALTKEPD